MRMLVLAAMVIFSSSMCAQTAPAPKPLTGAIASHPEWPKAKPADVDSIDHMLASLYDVISGPAHQPRDWVRMRSLFVPGAKLIPVRATATGVDVVQLSIDDYIARATGVMESEGFFEKGTHNEIAQFGDIVHVFSTYESRHALADAKPFARGINSIQMLKDGDRYWIVNIYWDSERPETPIPARYLPMSAAPDPSSLNQNMTGEWVGQLEYRDFTTNERTIMPAWMTMTPGADGSSATFSYVFDEGPGKTVRGGDVLAFSAVSPLVGFYPTDGNADALYQVSGVEEFRKRNLGTFVLTGEGEENKKPVDVRITFSLRRNLFTLLKETRPIGTSEAFRLRDRYTFTRATAPNKSIAQFVTVHIPNM
jgi:hypothetical protein